MAPGEELSGCLAPSRHRLDGCVTLCLYSYKLSSTHFRTDAYLRASGDYSERNAGICPRIHQLKAEIISCKQQLLPRSTLDRAIFYISKRRVTNSRVTFSQYLNISIW